MKVAFIGTKGLNFGIDSFGGFETVITELAPRFSKKGLYITVYCRKKLYKTREFPKQVNGVELKFYPSIETKNLGTMTNSLLAVIDSIMSGVDVVLLFNIGLGIYIPLLKLFGIKVITNLDGVEWERSKWSRIAKLMFKVGAFFNVRFADALISDANEIRKVYLQKFKKESYVIPYGAELRDDLTESGVINLGLVPNKYYLLATRFIPENNPLFIIRSFLKTNTAKPLVVLGRNYYNSKYEEEIKSIKDERIIFVDHITNRKLLLEFYKHCYVYIHGHSVGGTNPTMLEALANSTCVLAHDNVFNREMLENEKYGCFFALDERSFVDKINFLECNPKTVELFKRKSRERIIKYYNWDLVTEKYLTTLKSI